MKKSILGLMVLVGLFGVVMGLVGNTDNTKFWVIYFGAQILLKLED